MNQQQQWKVWATVQREMRTVSKESEWSKNRMYLSWTCKSGQWLHLFSLWKKNCEEKVENEWK